MSALGLAAGRGYVACVEALLKAGADPKGILVQIEGSKLGWV